MNIKYDINIAYSYIGPKHNHTNFQSEHFFNCVPLFNVGLVYM